MRVIKRTKLTVFGLFMGLMVYVGSGCAPHDYKAEADRDVYNLLESQWQDEFGSKANYKISDTKPLPNDVRMDRSIPNLGILTLPQAVALATAYNREYQSQREALYLQALDLRLSRYDFENHFFGGFGASVVGDSNDAVLGFEANVGVNRLLTDGTQLGARVAAAWVEVLTGNLQGGVTSILGVTVVKPLLRNSKRNLVLENLTQTQRDTLYQIRAFNRYRKTFVVSVITEYYQTLLWREKARYARDNREALVELHDHTQKLVQAGLVPKLELNRLHQEVLQAHDRYLQLQRQYEQALDRFKLTLSIDASTPLTLDLQELSTLRNADLKIPAFSEREVVSAALLRRLDLANVSDRVIDAQRKITVAKDQLRAELSLVGRADLVTSEQTDRLSLNNLENEYGLGLDLDLPLDRMAEATAYRQAQINLLARKRDYEQATTEIGLAIRDAHRRLTEADERHKTQSEALTLAKKRLNDTTVLLRHNRVSTRRVLQAIEDLYEAQTEDAQALVDFSIALLEFYRDTGILRVQPDGMWKL